MRYVVNRQGRKLSPQNDIQAEKLIARGFTEITKDQWLSKEFFPELINKNQVIQPKQEKVEVESNIIETRIV